jgi:peptide/nickel transport system permease protein
MAATEAAEVLAKADVKKRRGLLSDMAIRLVKEKPLGLVGGIIVLLLLLTGIFAEIIAPHNFNDVVPIARLKPPSPDHMLGTDNLGRDLLSRIIFGARVSMIVGLTGAALGVTVAFLIGGISGFYGGKVDMIVQRFVETLQCFPSLVVFMTVMAIVGQGMVPLIMVLGISSGILGSRTTRSAVIGIKGFMYVSAAEAIGARIRSILWRHIVPNIIPVLIIEFTLSVGRMILAESTLSFLGLGIPPPMPTWGGMLSGAGRQYMLQAPWMVLWPGLALALTVYGINVLGDALRDLWDPRLRGGLGRYGRKVQKPVKEAKPKMATA